MQLSLIYRVYKLACHSVPTSWTGDLPCGREDSDNCLSNGCQSFSIIWNSIFIYFIHSLHVDTRACSGIKMLHQLFQPFNSFTFSFSSLHHDNVQRRCSICQWTPALTWDALTRSFVMRCTQYSVGISFPFIPLYRLRPALTFLQLLYTRW